MARGQIGSHSSPQHGPQADTHFLSGLLTFHIEVVVLSYRAAGVARPCWGNFFFQRHVSVGIRVDGWMVLVSQNSKVVGPDYNGQPWQVQISAMWFFS